MSQKQRIASVYKPEFGDPVPLPDGGVKVAVFDCISWHCTCGLPLLYFGRVFGTMEHQCGCGQSYEIDGVHGLTPRVSLLLGDENNSH